MPSKIIKKKFFKYIHYFLIAIFSLLFLKLILWSPKVNEFLNLMELKTLDLRFAISSKYIKPNPNIVILNIDDNSLEILENEFGRWPWTRDAYIKALDYLESGHVDSIAFDIMFLGYQRGFESKDKAFIKSLKDNNEKYNNIYLSMNFDNRENSLNPVLPDKLKVKFENLSHLVNFSNLEFTNYRPIIKDFLEKPALNIGIVNASRDIDGISRHTPLLFKYKDDFYPYLSFKVAYDYIQRHENLQQDKNKLILDKNNRLILGKRKIQLNNEALALMNWYGSGSTFQYIPFWQLVKSIKDQEAGRKPSIPAEFFRNKIVFVGVSAVSLFDVKSIPLDNAYPGVEIQATVTNNIIDNNFIKKVNPGFNSLICIILAVITCFSVLKFRSALFSSLSTILLIILYIVIATFIFRKYFLWIAIINPVLFSIFTFILTYMGKYISKSQDLENMYKLATTDGLTNLYNHRYFQENLAKAIEKYKKQNIKFSLLLIDIDLFKKFNDTYGHQAGDIVLKQVAHILKKRVKSSDFVARYGGEEMAIILNKATFEQAVNIANRICQEIARNPFKLGKDIEKHVTVSIGVATCPEHGEISSELIEFSDQGLYKAKENGRNQVGIK